MTKKILIIDDEEDVRTYLTSLLKNNGYEIAVATDGEEGFSKLSNFYPNLIILDIIMPNQTGVGFYRKLRKSEVYKDIPVIVLSGVTRYKEFFARDHRSLPKPQDFVEKPFATDDLLNKVQHFIQ
jgi:CheY-like chemotaxis protein